ncbi:membrane protein, partial [Salmonella enterica subsp. enterica serovar Bareilly str. CFSAN000755]
MKLFLTTAALPATLVSGMSFASDPVIPWATNSGGTESTHISAMGEDLNSQHQ